jgi:ATPase family associated with various cellular activities (AAA)
MTAPSDFSLGYLLGRLAIVEARVAAAVAERRRTDPAPDDAFRGLYLADEHVDRLLGQPGVRRMLGHAPADVAELRSTVEEAADRAEASGATLRLRRLAAAFELSESDVDILLVALAPDVDARFEKLYGYLHDDVARRRASIGLALELTGGGSLDPAARGRFGANAPLRRSGLLVVDDADRPFLTRALRVPDRVTAALLGDTEPPAELRPVLHDPAPLAAAIGDRVNRALSGGVGVVYCKQSVGTWAGSVVVAALAEQGRAATVVDLSLGSAESVPELVRLAVREARLADRVLVLGPVDGLDRPTLRQLTGGPAPVVLYGTVPWDPTWSETGVLGLDLETLAHRPADRIWADALAAAGADPAAAIALSPFRLAPDQVTRAVAAGRSAAAADGAALSVPHLAAGARMQNGVGLGRLARRIDPSVGWADLVLPPAPLAGLHHLSDRVRLRDKVLGEWGLRRAGGRGEGVTALFAGEPGTGKTMAAEVVAGELGLDLYVIDLASVVDKYIGETEKNLERLFAGAEGVHGVLFFDEADALFGKRSEVSDARDRYANLEVAYLLQRMETFDGLAILATNLGSNLDEAFARRLSLVVEFARPDKDQRLLLWQKSLASVPLGSDVDLDFCAAAFELAGGDIRNIAVTVAYVAAAEGGIADMTRLVRAVQLEYRKLGRLCVEAEFGEYYKLLPGVS